MLLLLACATSTPSSGTELLEPLPNWSRVDTGVVVVDTAEDTAVDADPVEEEPELPNLVFNEVMTKNASTLFVDDTFPDWIELHNASAEAIDLGRVSITDNNDLPWVGPSGTVLSPGEFITVYATGSLDGGMYAPFGLDGDGDHLVLKVDGYPVDRLATGDMFEDVSWARFPDGGDWAPTITCTPGATNGTEPSDSLDVGESLFDLQGMNVVELEMSSASISSITSNSYVEVEAESVTINGATFGPVDVKIRGSATRRSWGQKASLKVDLNAHIDAKYRGLEKLTLINMIWDQSYAREWVAYAMMREAGVPAARTSYTYLYVNGDLFGIFLFTETYDDAWLRHWFGNDEGYLWEANGDFSSPGSWDCEEGYPCDTTNVSKVYSVISNYDADTTGMEKVEEYINLENMMREWILENAMGQWDGYTSPHNYRIYQNPEDGLMYMIPSSLDYTFDNPYNWTENIYYGNGALMRWCFAESTCKDRYSEVAIEIADMLEEMDWDAQIDALREVLDPIAGRDYDDPQGQYTHAQYESQIEYMRTYMLAIPDTIREQAN